MKRSLLTVVVLLALLSAVSLPSFAEINFVPSIEAKTVPEILEQKEVLPPETLADIVTSESDYCAYVWSSDDIPLSGVEFDDITFFSIVDIPKIQDQGLRQTLQSAYDEIKNTSTLNELVPNVQNYVDSEFPYLQLNDFVVSDMFELSLDSKHVPFLREEGSYFKITFQIQLPLDAAIIIVHKQHGIDWEFVPAENISRHNDGSLTVKFQDLCPVALLVNTAGPVIILPENPQIKSPQTGDTVTPSAVVAWTVIFFLASAAGYIMLSKQNKKDHT